MSHTAIFIAGCSDDFKQGQLPGDLAGLQSLLEQDDRLVHLELVLEGTGSDKAIQAVRREGGLATLLPITANSDASLGAGLAARLLEFIDASPDTEHLILAGASADRLVPAAIVLRRSGCRVTLCTTERKRNDNLRTFVDSVKSWGKGARAERSDREDKPAADPYEVLVEEVTRSRKNGRRVLLTSLKQRMRRRIRRFDETKIKDEEGRPMRKFKDFVAHAAERGLVQILENGNKSEILLPDEDLEEAKAQLEADAAGAEDNSNPVDPLLDAVDSEGDAGETEEAGKERGDSSIDERDLSESDFDVETLNEDTRPPPIEFVETIEAILAETEGTALLTQLAETLVEKRRAGELEHNVDKIQRFMQAAFNNELLETVGDESPVRCQLADDWRDIIGYL